MSSTNQSDIDVSIQDLSKSFGNFKALERGTFDVSRGDCLLLMGSNGAGKTTLLKILSGLSRPTEGRVHIRGINLQDLPATARSKIGFLSHAPQLYGELSARENLIFFGRLFGVEHLSQRVEELMEIVELEDRARDLVRNFSRGMQQRVSIAKTFLHHPSLVLLDEPHSGLDPYATSVLNRLFEQYHEEGRTLILSTHDLKIPLKFINKLSILRRGRLVHFAAIDGISSTELHDLFVTYR